MPSPQIFIPPASSQLKHALAPIENSSFSFFCPLSALSGVDRAELSAEADQGTDKQPWEEDRTKSAHAPHCLATAQVLQGWSPRSNVQKDSGYSKIRYQKC